MKLERVMIATRAAVRVVTVAVVGRSERSAISPKEVTRSKLVDLPAAPPNHRLTVEQNEELTTRFVRTDQFLVGRKIQLVRNASERGEVPLRQTCEERNPLQRLKLAIRPTGQHERTLR
jgi:hypothetical protein